MFQVVTSAIRYFRNWHKITVNFIRFSQNFGVIPKIEISGYQSSKWKLPVASLVAIEGYSLVYETCSSKN